MNILKSRRSKIITAAAVGLTLGFTAFASAYWSGGGTGTGQANTANGFPAITVNVAPVGPSLTPGGFAQALTGTFTNVPTNGVHVASLDVVVDPTFSAQADTAKPACTPADFVIYGESGADLPLQINALVKNSDPWSGAYLAMNNPGTNQDNCKGLTVPLVLTAS